MKIFKENTCLVSFKDLIYKKMPKTLHFDKEEYSENDYVIFSDPNDIEYIRSWEDIIDYDSVKYLSKRDLDTLISKVESDLEPFYIQFMKIPFEERGDYINNFEHRNIFYTLDKIYYDLLHYRNNKEEEDLKILEVQNNIPMLVR